jgi:hypothetical protein
MNKQINLNKKNDRIILFTSGCIVWLKRIEALFLFIDIAGFLLSFC